MKLALLAALLLVLVPKASSADPAHAGHAPESRELGTVNFPVSCNAAAQRHFTRAAAWLHSFEYEEAEKGFLAAAAVDPTCAMAQWGVAMSNYHPLWAPPTPGELAKGKSAMALARRLGGRTAREQGYIDALEPFFRDAGKLDHGARTLAYAAAMERLHRRHPTDDEAAVLYALALIAAGMLDDDPTYARETKAAGLLNGVLARAPDHPGVAHYLIHSYDYPALAHLALPAARVYAGIAPASAHAQHMPSHIFVRLGLWEEAVRSNLAAEAAAKAYARSRAMPGAWDEELHAVDYLAYGYLQLGRDKDARAVLAALNRIERVDPPNFKAAYAFSAVPARYALERRRWDEAAALTLPPAALKAVPWSRFPWAEAHVHFARAVGAARGRDVVLARREVARLGEIRKGLPAKPGEYDWGGQVEIAQRIAAAWLAMAEGRSAEAVSLMRAAADLDDATEKHPVTPGAILPAREQLGELLLEMGKPAEALAAFEGSLQRAPGRINSIYGAARAAQQSGSSDKAGKYRATLVELCRRASCERPELKDVPLPSTGQPLRRR
jgi:tetratricopeptide (TPR) repeat protein